MSTNNQYGASHNNSYLKAKKAGFDFTTAEKNYSNRVAKKEEIIEEIGETPTPFKTILSFICIVIALVLGAIEAQNVKASIVSIGNMDENTALVVGFAFCCLGLLCGEMLSSGFKTDEFTQKRKPTTRWYIALGLTALYVGGQYYLASRAGVGADDQQETVTTVKMFVLGIAIIEVLFGYLFLSTAIKTLTLFIATIRIKIAHKKLSKNAHNAEELWQRYTFDVEKHNTTRKTQPPIVPAEETEAIKQARQFFNTGGNENY